ncbi:MAG: hypothetical protein QXT58_01275 [Archaeoglobaceae archaeon]
MSDVGHTRHNYTINIYVHMNPYLNIDPIWKMHQKLVNKLEDLEIELSGIDVEIEKVKRSL